MFPAIVLEEGEPFHATWRERISDSSCRLQRMTSFDSVLEVRVASKIVRRRFADVKSILLHGLRVGERSFRYLCDKGREEGSCRWIFVEDGSFCEIGGAQDILQWQIPSVANNVPLLLQPGLLNKRLNLMLSKTKPVSCACSPTTIPDVISTAKCVMTDGCAGMGINVFRAVGDKLGEQSYSVVQARVNGCKGVWYCLPPMIATSGSSETKGYVPACDPDAIQIRDSQVKIQGTFTEDKAVVIEVCRTNQDVSMGSLNAQFIPFLEAGGISRALLLELLSEYLCAVDVLCSGRASPYPQLYDPYTDVEPVAGYEKLMPCRSVDAISPGSKEHYHRFSCRLTPNGSAQRRLLGAEYAHRLHLQLKYGWSWLRLPRRPGDGTTPRAAPHEVQIPEWPSLSSLVQQLLYYSHMEGERCDEFISLCKSWRSIQNEQLRTKFNIPVRCSRRLIVIADPTNTLAPGEVFVRFFGCQPVTGSVLIGRNPCYLPQHIQKAKCGMLPQPWGTMLHDVVVFSTQGTHSIASLLHGDFDGDNVWVCYDPRMVDAYRPIIGSIEAENEYASKGDIEETKQGKEAADGTRFCTRQLYCRAMASLIEATLAAPKFASSLGRMSSLHAALLDEFGVRDERVEKLGKVRYCLAANGADSPGVALGRLCVAAIDAGKDGSMEAIMARIPTAWETSAVRPHWMPTTKLPMRRERVSVSALGRLFDAVNAWYEAPKPPLPPLSQTLEVFQRMVQQAKKNSVTWNCYLNWASKVNQWYKAQEGMGAPDDGLRSCGTLSCLGPCGFVVPLYSAGKGRQRPGKAIEKAKLMLAKRKKRRTAALALLYVNPRLAWNIGSEYLLPTMEEARAVAAENIFSPSVLQLARKRMSSSPIRSPSPRRVATKPSSSLERPQLGMTQDQAAKLQGVLDSIQLKLRFGDEP